MDILIYKIVGPFFVMLCLGVLINFKRTVKMMEEFWESKSLLFVMGMISLLMGLVIMSIVYPASWEMWLVYIFFGVGAFLKGILFIIFPKGMKEFSLSMMAKSSGLMKGRVFIMLLFGLWVTWLGWGAM